MHSPIGGPQKRAESWKAILEARKEGLVRSVGVSNFGVRHLQEMVDTNVEPPVINQVGLYASLHSLLPSHRIPGRPTPVHDSCGYRRYV